MSRATLDILHRDDIPRGGFAGLREHRLVQDRRAWGSHAEPHAWDGVGNFVYLADARFLPQGETGMHPHKEVDVITIMVDGRLAHGGTLENGEMLHAPDVQIQRAGGEGFLHNEVNPDDEENRILQLWVLPEERGQAADYQRIAPAQGEVTRIYGGVADDISSGSRVFDSQTEIDVALLRAGQEIEFEGHLIAYLSQGEGQANDETVRDGDLVRCDHLRFTATSDVQLTVVRSH